MASTKGRIVRLISKVALERATIVATKDIGGFRLLQLTCKTGFLYAGMKVQLLLPSTDMRTYTPVPARDGMLLLGWKHVSGPGADWVASAKVGDELPFVGPQRSLQLDSGPVIVIGDETSVAVAASFAVERPGETHAVIQSNVPQEVREAEVAIGLQSVDVVATGDTNATVNAVKDKLAIFPNAIIGLTGGADLVIAVREALRNAGVQNIKTKTYWVPGKTGLD